MRDAIWQSLKEINGHTAKLSLLYGEMARRENTKHKKQADAPEWRQSIIDRINQLG